MKNIVSLNKFTITTCARVDIHRIVIKSLTDSSINFKSRFECKQKIKFDDSREQILIAVVRANLSREQKSGAINDCKR